MKKNILYAQSGGVTPVINATACGVIETARQHKDRIGKVYAGKDGIIREVFEDLDPVNVQVVSFKRPTERELRHDFLWRINRALPERGEIAVFNRSHYEEVLTVRVHPEYLDAQYPGPQPEAEALWPARYGAIREFERRLAASNTLILKFWLNVSRDEQKRRFLRRLDTQEKNWKFNAGDVDERRYWDDYMTAYEDALRHTSRPWAPWFAIPADDKPFMRLTVARIVVATLESMGLRYPDVDAEQRAQFDAMRERLLGE